MDLIDRQAAIDAVNKNTFRLTSKDIIKALDYIIKAVKFREKMRGTHNCNDCAIKGCEYYPAWGESVRWNCPHWEEMK